MLPALDTKVRFRSAVTNPDSPPHGLGRLGLLFNPIKKNHLVLRRSQRWPG
jgi:hypothetical protein